MKYLIELCYEVDGKSAVDRFTVLTRTRDKKEFDVHVRRLAKQRLPDHNPEITSVKLSDLDNYWIGI